VAPRRLRLGALLALLVLATTVPLGLFAGWLVLASWEQQRAVVDRQAIDTARAISVAIDQEIESTIAALRVLSSLDLFTGPDLREFHALALRLLPAQPGWRAVLLADPAGQVVASTDAPPGEAVARPAADWARVVATTQRPAVSDLLEDPATGQPCVVIGVPVTREGRLRFVLGALIRTSTLGGILRQQNPPPDGVVTLLDRSRRILARTRGEEELVGKFPSTGFLAASARMTEGSWRDTLLEGTPAYASLSRSPLTGWTVGIGLPAAAIDGPLRRAFWALAAAGAAVLVIGVGGALVLGRLLVRSLDTASIAARALAGGEPLTTRPSRVAEIDELSRALREAATILDVRLREREEAERQRARAAEERERALVAEREARVAAEKDEARLAVTLRSIGDAVIATDAWGRVTMLNPVAQDLTGWTEAEAMGELIEKVFVIVDERSHRPLENPVIQVLQERRTVGLANHAVLVARDRRRIPIEDSAAPILTAGGSSLGVVLVFRDVTERREAERQRLALLAQEQAARQHAEALSRSKDEFVATVSHELRTPLNAIFGWVRLLRSGALDGAAQAHALDVVERNTRLQAQLVEDLVDMSRVVTGNLRLERRPVDLAAVLEAAVDAVRPAAGAKRLEIAVAVDRSVPPVQGDPDRLQQIAWNLLTNSIKFTPRDGRIEVRLGREGSEAVIAVSDNGVGIPADLLPHVFERFRQGTSTESRSHGGLGIGLALVRHLVELHGGRVTAESEGEGCGATFTVSLPLLGQPAVVVPVLPGAPASLLARGDSPRALEGLRVLVVDDEPDARDLICTALRQAGAEAVPAAAVAEALELLESLVPDVVLSDIAMPTATGYDLLRQARDRPRTAKVPMVALTAYNRLEDRERALHAGFDAHVGKPVEPLALVRAVAAAAGR
jgi:PAS domain S-box-containing protein